MTKSEYALYLHHQNDANVNRDLPTMATGMQISWSPQNYCGGFTYELVLISRDTNTAKGKQTDSQGNLLTLDAITAELNLKLTNTHASDGSNLNFSGFFDSTDWINPDTGIGTWELQVKGTTGSADPTGP